METLFYYVIMSLPMVFGVLLLILGIIVVIKAIIKQLRK